MEEDAAEDEAGPAAPYDSGAQRWKRWSTPQEILPNERKNTVFLIDKDHPF